MSPRIAVTARAAVAPVLAVALLWWPSAFAGSPAAQGPRLNERVPLTHWAYDAVNWFLQQGYDTEVSWESGRPSYTRRQFAGFVADFVGQAEIEAGIGAPGLQAHARKWRGSQNALSRLAGEFQPELTALGLDDSRFRATLAAFERVWKTGRPEGVSVPLVRWGLRRYDPVAREEGRQRAEEEWRRARPLLYLAPSRGRVLPRQIDLKDALPLEVLPRLGVDHRTRQMVAGHNERVWQLLREKGSAPDGKLAWTAKLFDLERTWIAGVKRALRLDRKHPGVVVPGGGGRLLWEGEDRGPPLEELPDGRLLASKRKTPPTQVLRMDYLPFDEEVRLDVPGFPPKNGKMDILWGPHGSGVIFLKLRAEGDREKPHRISAMDLRTGYVLNAAATK